MTIDTLDGDAPIAPPSTASPQLFEKRVNIALMYTCPPRVILIGTWNDFFESTALEPAREHGFTYLEILRKVLEGYGTSEKS